MMTSLVNRVGPDVHKLHSITVDLQRYKEVMHCKIEEMDWYFHRKPKHGQVWQKLNYTFLFRFAKCIILRNELTTYAVTLNKEYNLLSDIKELKMLFCKIRFQMSLKHLQKGIKQIARLVRNSSYQTYPLSRYPRTNIDLKLNKNINHRLKSVTFNFSFYYLYAVSMGILTT